MLLNNIIIIYDDDEDNYFDDENNNDNENVNNFWIYANSKTYILKIIMENSKNDLELKIII